MKLIDIELLCRVCERNDAKVVAVIEVDDFYTQIYVETGVTHRRIQKYLDVLFIVAAVYAAILGLSESAWICAAGSCVVMLASHVTKILLAKYRPPATNDEIKAEFARKVRAYHEGGVQCVVDAQGALLFRENQ